MIDNLQEHKTASVSKTIEARNKIYLYRRPETAQEVLRNDVTSLMPGNLSLP